MSFLSHRLRDLASQVALATVLATLAAPLTHASAATLRLRPAYHQVQPAFNPQPDSPGRYPGGVQPAFNPQPDSPGRYPGGVQPAFNPQPDPPG